MSLKKDKLDYPIYLFKEGTNSELYKTMGATQVVKNGQRVWRFRCWAPRAKSVSIVGEFNAWDTSKNVMQRVSDDVWEGCVGGIKIFDSYKFYVVGVDGVGRYKSDPFAIHTETPPANASKVYKLKKYKWHDQKYLDGLKSQDCYCKPINIYEVHIGSWKRHADGGFYTYRELAKDLIPYVKKMGYTHIEVMPVTEYPLDASWGYQTGFLFAPSSRFGLPEDFMYFVDCCHKSGIGVIQDLVISHFPKDEFGLYEFDGAPLYEYTDETKREHKGWGTRVYDFGRGEVRSFLTSAGCFWLENYHIDGLRLDAVASMLYLDYDRKQGEWRPNKFGGNYNLEAIEFLQGFNRTLLTRFPYAITIAEESTAFPMVTMPPDIGGLGFNFKWNMGWMNDTLDYFSTDALFRKGKHDKLSFSLTYAFSENYVLPLSHDEVVHGKKSLIGRMPGSYEDKFKGLKTLFAFQMTHPGKKLNFMGSEFGQFIEWDFNKGLDWCLSDYENHRNLQKFSKELNKVYLENSPLFDLDNSYDGFKWLVVDDKAQSVIAYYRQDKKGDRVVVIINLTGVDRKKYTFGVPDKGEYKVILNSNGKKFGGITKIKSVYSTIAKQMHGQNQCLCIDLEGYSALMLKIKR